MGNFIPQGSCGIERTVLCTSKDAVNTDTRAQKGESKNSPSLTKNKLLIRFKTNSFDLL